MPDFVLKDGSTTKDPRLGRIVHFDERSRNYPAVRLLSTEQQRKLRSYTWDCNLWLDQGSSSSCTFHAICHDLAARPVQVQGLTHEYALEGYYEAQELDPWPGSERPGTVPQAYGTAVIFAVQVAQQRGYYGSYSWNFSEEEMALSVGWTGPNIIGVNWTADMFNPDQNGFIRPTGEASGGHCILVRGISLENNCYRLHNSWGKNTWGINGEAFITREDMATLLSQDGECMAPTRTSKVTI